MLMLRKGNSSNGVTEKSPPVSPKETSSPRDSDSDEQLQQLAQQHAMAVAVVHLKKLIAEDAACTTREVKLQLAMELIEDFCNEASTKEESKQALAAAKSITHSVAKLQKKLKREKRKNKQSRRGTLTEKDSNDNNNDTVPTSIERDEPSKTDLTLGKKPSLMDMLEFLRSTSSISNDAPSPSILSQCEPKKRSDTQEAIDNNNNLSSSSTQDSSLASVSKKNNSLIDLFEFRNVDASSSVATLVSNEESSNSNSNKTNTIETGSSDGKASSTATGVIQVMQRHKLAMKRSEVDLFTFLSEIDDDDENDTQINDSNLATILMKTSLQPSLLCNPNKMLLDVVIIEMADIRVKESGQTYVTATWHQEQYVTAVLEGPMPSIYEDMTFHVTDPSIPFTIRVYNNSNDAVIGEVTIDVSTLIDGSVRDSWFVLQSKKTKDAPITGTSPPTNSEGKIHLKLNYKLENSMLDHVGIPSRAIPYRLKSGDILLFDKRTNLLSYGTKLLTRSRWDHVAMVIVLCNTLMVLEATSTDGVQLYPLDEKLEAYRMVSNIGVRRLQGAPSKEMLKALLDFIYEVKGRPYEKNLLELFKAVYTTPVDSGSTSKGPDDLSSLFCSELVAAAYQRMGLLSSGFKTNAFVPKDFATDKFTFSVKDATLGRVVVFKKRSSSSSSNSTSKRNLKKLADSGS
eukprot:TRINITY_DN4881_c0_g4_i2.p1 TRINITY_DN4881_c0_g4~~TRINITY_DN4881_c0_g4_i2.p1  ORF type:complete len:684 (-),score=178.69 TRINITY_DN4881_c0_g4_i2:120-2171(-)